MERKQVITITVEGTMQGLQVKPGQGLSLLQFGNATVIRASEIVFNETYQAWTVDVLQDAGQGLVTYRRFMDAIAPDDRDATSERLDQLATDGWFTGKSEDAALGFHSYEDAVRCEIAYLDALRLKGTY